MLGMLVFYLYILAIFIFLVVCILAMPKFSQERGFNSSYFLGGFYIVNLIIIKFVFEIHSWKPVVLNFLILLVAHIFSQNFKAFVITGQACTGKSWVAEYVSKRYKAKIINADKIFFSYIERFACGQALKQKLKEKVVDDKGVLDFNKIRVLVSNDEKLYHIITSMVGTRTLLRVIWEVFKEKILYRRRLIFVESSFFLKHSFLKVFVYPIFGIYTNNKAALVRRYMDTMSISQDEAEKYYSKQYSPQELQLLCDFCFINDSSLDKVQAQIEKLLSLLQAI